MATSNAPTEYFRLTRLPSDLLGQVVSFTPLALRLWLSGDVVLRRKLEIGVLEVTLTDKRWISLGIPPMVLARFDRLRHLSVQTGTGPVANKNTLLAQIIADLSSTLTSLAIPLHTYGRLPTLPTNLISLEIYEPYVISGIRFPDMSLLPRSLEKLLASVAYNSSDDWSLPPPALSTIRYLHVPSREEDLFFLPRTLTSCFLVPESSFTPNMFRSLPPGFHTLEIARNGSSFQDIEWLQALPSSLKCLRISGGGKIDLAAISRLPRSLTTLHANSVDLDDIVAKEEEGVDVEVWPPNLTDLTITDQAIHDYQLYLLPRTLKTLYMRFWPTKELNGSGLPPSITDVKWSVARDSRGPTAASCFVSIPPKAAQSLITWEMGMVPTNMRIFENWTSLTSLSFDWSSRLSPIKAGRFKFPPSLTELRSTSWRWDLLEIIPQRVIALEFETIDGKLPASEDVFSMLPLGLRRLAMGLTLITRKETLIFGAKSFSTLRFLESIDAPFLGEFESGVLRNISKLPYLRNLDITLASLDQKDAPFIPQNMNHELSLGPNINPKLPYIARYWPIPRYLRVSNDEELLNVENRARAKKRAHW